jgi:hypothetical protein
MRLFTLTLAITGLFLLTAPNVSAQDDGVTLSVTPGGRIAISVSPNALDFGLISPGETGTAGPVTVTNDGTVKVQLAVQYLNTEADCDPAGAVDWEATENRPHQDQFLLGARLDGGQRRHLDERGRATRLARPHLEIGASRSLNWELSVPPLPYGGADPTQCRIHTVVVAFVATDDDD